MESNNPFGFDPMIWALFQPNNRKFSLRQYFTEAEKYWSKELSTAEANLPVVNLAAGVGLTPESMRRETCLANIKLYRESSVITLYSFIEKELHEVCRTLIEYTDTEASLHPDGYLGGSKKTLKNICHFDWGDLDPEWQFIYSDTEGLRGVRNAYVHSSGKQSLAEREALVKKILRKHTDKEELDAEYVDMTLENIGRFFEKLKDKVWNSSIVQQKRLQEGKD